MDVLRRTLSVEEQVTSGVGKPPALTPTLKTPSSRRTAPGPGRRACGAVRAALEDHPDTDALFLAAKGGLWRQEQFNVSVRKPSLRAAG